MYPANFPDPQVVATPDGYLAVATNGNGMNVQTLTSADMVQWVQGRDALPSVASWSSSGKVWAPELLRLADGSWRLYYTTKGPDPERQCLSVARADRAEGPYTDTSAKPLVCENSEGGSIDASPFADADGSLWLYWKNDGNAVKADTYLKAQRLTADGLRVTGRPTRLFRQSLPWEGTLVEAPAVALVDGVYHLFYSANDYGTADYAVGHATAASPTGPFVRDPEPVLRSNAVAAGPGHCQLLKVGDQWWVAYHAWSADAIGDDIPGRQLWLSKVTFDGTSADVQPPTADQPQLP